MVDGKMHPLQRVGVLREEHHQLGNDLQNNLNTRSHDYHNPPTAVKQLECYPQA